MAPCAPAPAPLLMCGRLVWLPQPGGPAAGPRRDRRNQREALRDRPLLGIMILDRFHQSSPGVWTGGHVYNPEDGRTYSGAITLNAAGRLQLDGCALVVFCQRQVWTRVRG